MRTVTSSEFRRNASAVMDLVENGEVVQVLRHGRVIAKIIPSRGAQPDPAWKHPGVRIVAPGASLSRAVLEERRSSR